MKALSVQQPWAWLLVNGPKDVENRTWRTDYTGPLLIHAPRTVDTSSWNFIAERVSARVLKHLRDACAAGKMPTQAIIGRVELVMCVESSPSRWFEGPYGLMVVNPMRIETPVKYSGRLGLFDIDDALLAQAVFLKGGRAR